MMGHIELILSSGLSEQQREENIESLKTAMGCGRLLLSIIQDILDLSKIEAGQLDIVHQPLSLQDLVEDTMKLAKVFRLQRKKLHIEIYHELDDTLAPSIYGDFCRVQQVLTNLLTNAIKFTDEGSIALNIVRCSDNKTLEFSVCDSGKGIRKDKLDIIFDPFRQIEIGDSRQQGGTGKFGASQFQ
jgi:signal transduction histidine kinase